MKEKPMTDEELANAIWDYIWNTPHKAERTGEAQRKRITRLVTESRKGMFTEEEVKDFGMFMCEPNWKGIDTDFEQWLTERKGR